MEDTIASTSPQTMPVENIPLAQNVTEPAPRHTRALWIAIALATLVIIGVFILLFINGKHIYESGF